jgi:hypothetical protein
VFCASCQFIKFDKRNDALNLDTIVDFSSVDVSPTFAICDAIIDQSESIYCFRTTIHQKISEKLLQYSFQVNQSIDEVVVLRILINNKGKIVFQSLIASNMINEELPQLDSLLQRSVEGLPTIFPAIKRGIPVATQYQLPIRIRLAE